MESGGNEPVSVGPVTPSHCNPTVWAVVEPATFPGADVEALRDMPGGTWGSEHAFGSCGRCSRPGIVNSRLMKTFFRGPFVACATIMSEVRRLIPF
jgi:hypothetical protein